MLVGLVSHLKIINNLSLLIIKNLCLGYIIGMDAVAVLYNESFSVPIFHIEDVYLTGLVADKLKIRRTNHPLFLHYLIRDSCAARGMICQQRESPLDIQKLYHFVINFDNKCKFLETKIALSRLFLTGYRGCHVDE